MAVLSIICGLIGWHVIYWHSTGMYLEMFQWLQTGRGYLTAVYNLGLMLLLGVLFDLLINKITVLVGREDTKAENRIRDKPEVKNQ